MKEQLDTLIAQMHRSGILYAESVSEFKKRFILEVLQEAHGNQCKAARELGMHRNTLKRTIGELKIDIHAVRENARRPPHSARPPELEKTAVQ